MRSRGKTVCPYAIHSRLRIGGIPSFFPATLEEKKSLTCTTHIALAPERPLTGSLMPKLEHQNQIGGGCSLLTMAFPIQRWMNCYSGGCLRLLVAPSTPICKFLMNWDGSSVRANNTTEFMIFLFVLSEALEHDPLKKLQSSSAASSTSQTSDTPTIWPHPKTLNFENNRHPPGS